MVAANLVDREEVTATLQEAILVHKGLGIFSVEDQKTILESIKKTAVTLKQFSDIEHLCATIPTKTLLRTCAMEEKSQEQTCTTLPAESVSWSKQAAAYRLTPEGKAWHAQLQRAAKRLEEAYSSIPWHAERAKKDPNYWLDLAASAPYF